MKEKLTLLSQILSLSLSLSFFFFSKKLSQQVGPPPGRGGARYSEIRPLSGVLEGPGRP